MNIDISHLKMKYMICMCPQFADFIFVGARCMVRLFLSVCNVICQLCKMLKMIILGKLHTD